MLFVFFMWIFFIVAGIAVVVVVVIATPIPFLCVPCPFEAFSAQHCMPLK